MAPLLSSTGPLATSYDVALVDLDGVVYVGPLAVPAAPAALAQARRDGMRLAFVTNNAARPPAVVAEHLNALGIPAQAGDVITSAQAGAHYLADRLPAGARVLVCGTSGIVEALRERGLQPVFSADEEPAAVLQGYSPSLDWAQLAEAAVAIRRGALWVATNLDRTVPSARGLLPGNGSMVAALRHATGAQPLSTGKPDPRMHLETVERSNALRPIVVGDRLDTDIEGARAVGCDSLLVFSGVTTPRELLNAVPEHRPDYLAADLSGLGHAHPRVDIGERSVRCGGWLASEVGGAIHLSSAGAAPGEARSMAAGPDLHSDSSPNGRDNSIDDGLDGLRAVAALYWEVGSRTVRGDDPLAEAAIEEWGIG